MYQAHFGLKKRLFDGGIAQQEAVFIGPRQQLVVANFKVALTTLDSAIVLTGATGVGKTTIACAALRTTSTRLALGWLSGTPANGTEMLEQLLAEFGFNPHRIGRAERLQMWRQFLNEMNATDSRVFVVAEHADEMDADVLRALQTVTAADPNGGSGANLVLLGQPELNERLKLPALGSLTQRIRLRQQLEPFTVEELDAYLRHCVALAGGDFGRVFEPGAVGTLHQYSAGMPRVVNNLCETALTLAATGAERQLTSQLIMRVAVGLYGIEPPAPATASTVAAPAPVAAPAAEEPPVLTDAIDAPAEHQPEMAAANAPDAARAANVEAAEDDLPHQAQTMLPLAAAKPLDDISNSMAEALFGDADLDMLSAALASAGWSDTDNDVDGVVENPADTASDDSATMETPRGKYASFGASSDGELQLLADAPAEADGRARKVASTH